MFSVSKWQRKTFVFQSVILRSQKYSDNKYLPKCEWIMEPFKKGIGFNYKNMARGSMKQF